MLAYKTISSIDENGYVIIKDLPFKNKENVEVILLLPDLQTQTLSAKERKKKLESSFGTIKTDIFLSDESLRRDNLYSGDGR
jgi:hypothetical protein